MNELATQPSQAAKAAPTHGASTVHSLVSERSAVLSRMICRTLFLPLYYTCTLAMKFKAGYQIPELAQIRKSYRELAEVDGPLLICANHLTIIDSALLLWAFGSGPWYLRNFHRFSWNLPAGDFFKKKLFYRFMGAISKCIFIHRDGSKQHKDSVLTVCGHLARAGEVVTFFPEGKRSRTGRFDPDHLTYGIGKVVSELGSCRVLCAYVRGDQQETFSNYPPKGSRFHVEMKVLSFDAVPKNRDGYQQVVGAIGHEIKGMEDRYFDR